MGDVVAQEFARADDQMQSARILAVAFQSL
jgi:hypothetical protein